MANASTSRVDSDLDAQSPAADLVRVYLNGIGKTALLTAADEVELAKRIEAGLYAGYLLGTRKRLGENRKRDLAAVAYGAWHNGLISLAILAASVPLPWMAVLIANDRPPRRSDEPRRFDDARRRTPLFPRAELPALDPPRHQEPQPGSPPGGDAGE